MRANTGVDALNDSGPMCSSATVEDVTSFTDDDPLRQEDDTVPSTETRMYRVGSVATGIDDPEPHGSRTDGGGLRAAPGRCTTRLPPELTELRRRHGSV